MGQHRRRDPRRKREVKSRLSSATHQLRLSGHIQARPDLDSSEETQSSRILGLKGVI